MLLCIISFSGFSQVQEAPTTNETPDYLSDGIPLERKLRRLKNAENHIAQLPFERDVLRSEIIPGIETKRKELAPNYPDLKEIFGTEKDQLQEDWIMHHIDEFDAYILYLETYLRSFR